MGSFLLTYFAGFSKYFAIMIILLHQASRFLTGDWASGLGSESGFLCQGYPVLFYTTQVRNINICIQ